MNKGIEAHGGTRASWTAAPAVPIEDASGATPRWPLVDQDKQLPGNVAVPWVLVLDLLWAWAATTRATSAAVVFIAAIVVQ